MSSILVQIRVYEESDYEMIGDWFTQHKRRGGNTVVVPKHILPPIGQIAFRETEEGPEDLAALWLYLAQASPVCFVEHAVTKPGLRLATAKLALLSLLHCMRRLAGELGYHFMIAHALPGMARYMEHVNWFRGDGDLIAMWTPTSCLQEAH